MNRRKLESLLLTLESTAALLARAARDCPPGQAARRPAAGGFSLVENVWHLADLEREAYGVRIRRLLAEDEPTMSNFDGDRVAREREYQRRSLAEGLAAFARSRRRNLDRLREVSASDWSRAGVQESVGRITLADVPAMMAAHDRSHGDDISALLAELSSERPLPLSRPRPTSAVA